MMCGKNDNGRDTSHNSIALRKAKIVCNSGLPEYNRIINVSFYLNNIPQEKMKVSTSKPVIYGACFTIFSTFLDIHI